MSVTFGEEWIEISFTEQRDFSDDVIDLKTRLISPKLFADEVEDILDSLTDLLDRAAIHRRNPVQKFRAARTLDDAEETDA
jgi:hypothetical protein